MHTDCANLSSPLTLLAENGKKFTCFLTEGTRITNPENPAITPIIDRALIVLADLTEYHKLGGTPGHDLSIMIERGDAYILEHNARLRELVDAGCAQLRLWLEAPDTKLARKHRKHRKDAKECLYNISEF